MDNDAVFMRKGLNVKELYHETDTSGRHLSAKGKEHLMKHMIEIVKNIRQKRLQDHTKEDIRDSVVWGAFHLVSTTCIKRKESLTCLNTSICNILFAVNSQCEGIK